MLPFKILAGVGVLLFGRRLFWLFVGVVGFIFGVELATLFLQPAPELAVIAVGLMAGVIGALLAYFLQKMVIAVAGFMAGGYVAVVLAGAFIATSGKITWLPFAVGGAIGAILVLVVFDWALILLSSLVGARLIVEVVAGGSHVSVLLFVALFAVGVIFQAAAFTRRQRSASG